METVEGKVPCTEDSGQRASSTHIAAKAPNAAVGCTSARNDESTATLWVAVEAVAVQDAERVVPANCKYIVSKM